MNGRRLTLRLLPVSFAICRLEPDAALPAWLPRNGFTAVIRTRDEMAVYCDEAVVPQDVRAAKGWRALELVGPFESTFGTVNENIDMLMWADVVKVLSIMNRRCTDRRW